MKKSFAIFILLLLFTSLFACSDECRHRDMKRTVFEPDCSSEGYTLSECADCGYSYKCDFKAPSGHLLEASEVDAACDAVGYVEYSCRCGFSYRSDYEKPTGHKFTSRVTEPTCTEAGYTLYECICGYSYKSDTVSPKGHELEAKELAATCTESGYTEYSCKRCDERYVGDIVLPKGHDFSSSLVYPTYISTGYTRYKCDCGFEYNGSFVMSSELYTGAYGVSDTPIANGVDLSKWNGEIDFAKLSELGIDFVILKAGSTKSGVDPYFEANYSSAKAAGLDVGAYFYTYSTTADAALSDAKLCARMLEGKQFEYPIYFDLEDPTLSELSRELLTEMCEVFIKEMQSSGYFCGLYVNHDWLTTKLHTEKATVYFDLWYARWTVSGKAEWKESFGQKPGLWQYTDAGELGGIDGHFDLNVAYKDYPELIKKYKLNGF